MFLKPSIAKEAADILGTKNIWFNTGTFTSFYSTDPSTRVYLTLQQRSRILKGIIAQGQWLKSRGYKVNVSLFAENKASTSEGVDWSYWHGSSPSGATAALLKGFIAELKAKKIGFWLFDTL